LAAVNEIEQSAYSGSGRLAESHLPDKKGRKNVADFLKGKNVSLSRNQKTEYYTECRNLFFASFKLQIGYLGFQPFDFWTCKTLNAKKDQKTEMDLCFSLLIFGLIVFSLLIYFEFLIHSGF
jgi:hypothetical protein